MHSRTVKLDEAAPKLAVYREIFANASDGVAILEPDFRYVEQNEAHRVLTGYTSRGAARSHPRTASGRGTVRGDRA